MSPKRLRRRHSLCSGPTSDVHVLAEGIVTDGINGNAAWSPDGTRLALSVSVAEGDVRADPGLWLYSRDGGEPIHLVSEFQVRVSNGAWQPLP
jgi:dipeptidyl aminopeptidase/acylaminoacyl peptidase